MSGFIIQHLKKKSKPQKKKPAGEPVFPICTSNRKGLMKKVGFENRK
jgi:hypothetical protein